MNDEPYPPLTLDDFEPFRPSLKGDATNTSTYSAVGFALSHWEALELEVTWLFATVLREQNFAANRALGALASAMARADAIEASLDYGLIERPDLVPPVKEFLKLYKKGCARRNEIAHGVCTMIGDENGKEIGFQLIPGIHNPRKFTMISDHKYRYNSHEITEYGMRFLRLKTELTTLIDSMRSELLPFSDIDDGRGQ